MYIEQRLFFNKGIEMMKNCAIIMQTTIEASTFWNKRASSITIITDENETRNASEQENEFACFLIMEKQTQKREKNKIEWSHFRQRKGN